MKISFRLMRLVCVCMIAMQIGATIGVTAQAAARIEPVDSYTAMTHASEVSPVDSVNYATEQYSQEQSSHEQSPQVMYELAEKREANVKHFVMSDDSIQAVVYDEPVHFLHDGAYQSIDNRLERASSVLSKDGQQVYRNRANRFAVEFPVTLDEAHRALRLSKRYGTHEVALAYIPLAANTVHAKLTAQDAIQSQGTQRSYASGLNESTQADWSADWSADKLTDKLTDTAAQLQSTIVYDGVEEGVSLRYSTTSQGIKEDIVIERAQAQYGFSFVLSLTGMSAEHMRDGSIEIYDDEHRDSVEYVIPAPVMIDAQGRQSDAVEYQMSALDMDKRIIKDASVRPLHVGNVEAQRSLILPDAATRAPHDMAEALWKAAGQTEGNRYLLTVSADKNWIENEQTVFPVVVDPAIVVSDVKDTKPVQSVIVRSDNTREQSSTLVEVAEDTVSARTYMKIQMPQLAPGDVITDARLRFEAASAVKKSDTMVYAINDAWDIDTVDWNNQPYAEKTYEALRQVDYGVLYQNTTILPTGIEIINFTRIAREWAEGTLENNGLLFVPTGAASKIRPYLSRGATGADTAYLVVTYRNHDGLESYHSAHSSSVGRAGVGAVDHYTGNLTFVHGDVASAGARMPLGIQHVYSSFAKSRQGDPVSRVGLGWRLNYQQTLRIPVDRLGVGANSAMNDFPWVYTDADGTEHYMKVPPALPVGETYAPVMIFQNGAFANMAHLRLPKDEDGLGLYVISTGDAAYPYRIQNSSGDQILYFDKIGRLARITDSNQHINGGNQSQKQLNAIELIYEPVETTAYAEDQADVELFSGVVQRFIAQADDRTMTTATKNALFDEAKDIYNRMIAQNAYMSANKSLLQPAINLYQAMKDYVLAGSTASLKSNHTNLRTAFTELTTLFHTRLASVKDAAGITVTLTYDVQGNLASITDPTYENGEVRFTADAEGRINAIGYPDGRASQYAYSDGLLSRVTDGDYRVEYSYDAGTQRVVGIAEYAGEVAGNALEIAYHNGSTVYRTPGNDAVLGNGDDLENVYVFDEESRTRQVYTRNVDNSVVYGASNYQYDKAVDGSSARNRITETYQSGYNVLNLLKNHSAEHSGGWTQTPGAYYTQSTEQAYMGAKSFVYDSALTGTAVTSGGFSQKVPGIGEGTYTLSAYVKVKAMSGDGAYIRAMVDGKPTLSSYVHTTTDEAFENGWVRLSVTFEVPDDELEVEVFAGVQVARGQAWFDCLQLETGELANAYNMLENAGLEQPVVVYTEALDKYGWYGAITERSTTAVWEGAYSLSVNASSAQYRVLSNPKKNEVYVLSGWVKTELLPLKTGAKAEVEIINATAIAKVTLYDSSTDWRYFSVALTIGDTPSQNTRFNIYNSGRGKMYVDGLQLVKQQATHKQYDPWNNLQGVISASGDTKYTYTAGTDQIKTATARTGAVTTYVYYDNNDLKNASNNVGHTAHYDYDTFGNVTGTHVTKSTTLPQAEEIYTSAQYTADGRFPVSYTDERGYTSYTAYEAATGLVNSVTNAKGTETNFGYTALRQMESVERAEVSNTYAYDTQKRLTSIAPGDAPYSYAFRYDPFGNVLSAGVHNVAYSPLLSHAYTEGNGKLEETAYGNGDAKAYAYDDLGRVTGVAWNDAPAYTWAYNSRGEVARHMDLVNMHEYQYEYDHAGRLVREYVNRETCRRNCSGTDLHHISCYVLQRGYNLAGQLTKTETSIHGEYKQTTFAYGTGTSAGILQSVTLPNQKVTYTYDTQLKRMSKKQYTTGNFSTEYRYLAGKNSAGGAGLTTMLSGSTTKQGAIVLQDTEYVYDELGNISQMTVDGLGIRYAYDAFNQLVREDNAVLNVTTTYVYDNAGNMLEKRKHDYTTAKVVGAVTDTDHYTYAQEGWTDRLTGYNDDSITYDGGGNPLSYRGHALTWQQGRQLASYDGVRYGYNANGLRVSKSTADYATRYYLDGDLIVREEREYNRLINTGDIEYMDFYYDENGQAVSFTLQRYGMEQENYTYVRNPQGDVTGIFCNGGEHVVAKYIYDSWGNVTAITDEDCTDRSSDAGHIGVINPIRYRGYYFDHESGLYYLQSRYYDPEVGRFVNADSLGIMEVDQGHLMQYNLYSYCLNNPVMYHDPSGHAATVTADEWARIMEMATAALAIAAAAQAALAAAPIVALAAIVVGIGALIPSDVAQTSSIDTAVDLSGGIGGIAGEYENLECDDAAKAVKDYITSNNQKSKTIIIQYEGDGKYNNVWSVTANGVISETGMHMGVMYNGNVYCNVHTTGLPEFQWLDDFEGFGARHIERI